MANDKVRVYPGDVAFWVTHWRETGETVTYAVACTIAEYWQPHPASAMATFARGENVDPAEFKDDIHDEIMYAKLKKQPTIQELYALDAWGARYWDSWNEVSVGQDPTF